jgi:hypothetical protein
MFSQLLLFPHMIVFSIATGRYETSFAIAIVVAIDVAIC